MLKHQWKELQTAIKQSDGVLVDSGLIASDEGPDVFVNIEETDDVHNPASIRPVARMFTPQASTQLVRAIVSFGHVEPKSVDLD